MSIEKFCDNKGNIAEYETYSDGGPNVVRLMTPGVRDWNGTVDEIRMPPIDLPPDTLYSFFNGTRDECLLWMEKRNFNVERMRNAL